MGTKVSGSSRPVGDEPFRYQYRFSSSKMSFSSTVGKIVENVSAVQVRCFIMSHL